MKNRFTVCRDYHAGIGKGGVGWAVYDQTSPNYADSSDDIPVAVFALSADAKAWARAQNAARLKKSFPKKRAR